MPYVSRDVEIYYAQVGDPSAEAVFFCHGAGGNATSWWQQLPDFAADYRCLAHDHRGFGRSRCTGEQFRVGEFAGDVLAIMDAESVAAAHFVCQSMGGWTGVQMALNHPNRIKSLVLSDTIGGIGLQSGLDSAATMDERAAQLGAINPALAPNYHEMNPAGAFLYTEISAFNGSFEELGLFAKLFAEEGLVSPERAGELDLPVLIFAGSNDIIWPPAVLHELAGHIDGARVVDIDSGHSPYFENPAAFNAGLREFLSSVGS
jgi:3-oxoadipate enol-lactonase